jgi:putative spermidine/putrescine transport system permease protein
MSQAETIEKSINAEFSPKPLGKPRRQVTRMWSWIILILGLLYFFIPLFSIFEFSLRAQKGRYSFYAYRVAFQDPKFYENFGYSLVWAILTIGISIGLIVPTAYWVHLRLRRIKPLVEFITLIPFVVPAVVLVFGMIRLYNKPPLILTSTPILLVFGYVTLSMPYMYRAVDTGLRAVDITTLTEAAQSLGANWFTILWRVIFPNLRIAILSGVFLTFAIVMGEFTFASLLYWPAFGPYIEEIGAMRAYTPQALSVVSFLITWFSMWVINRIARGAPGQSSVAGVR